MKKISFIILSMLSMNVFAGDYVVKFPMDGSIYKEPTKQPDNWITTDNLYITDWTVKSSDCKWSDTSYSVGSVHSQTRNCDNIEERKYQQQEINTINNEVRSVGNVVTENRDTTSINGNRNFTCYYDREEDMSYYMYYRNLTSGMSIDKVYLNNEEIDPAAFGGNPENNNQLEFLSSNNDTFILSNELIQDNSYSDAIIRYYPVCKTN